MDYVRLYGILFNGITDALGSMAEGDSVLARETLIRAQQAAEEYYIGAEEDDENGAELRDKAFPILPMNVLEKMHRR